jgi:hypothetical protein
LNLINEKVLHRQFGTGVITGQTETAVSVDFSKCGAKKFLYPSAFESFLELCNPVARECVAVELRQIRTQLDAKRKQDAEAEEAHNAEVRRLALEQKRTAAKRTAATKKTSAKPKIAVKTSNGQT